MKTKTCSRCKEILPLTPDNFYRNKSMEDGFEYYCKTCKSKIQKKLREKKKEEAKIERKTCTRCELEYPATNEHFHYNKNTKDKLHSWCKDCRYEVDKIRRERQRREMIRRENQYYKRKYKELINQPCEKGLELSDLKLDQGKTYKIKIRTNKHNPTKYFIGKLIQNEDRFITLQKENGLVESFLKVDLLRYKNIEVVE